MNFEDMKRAWQCQQPAAKLPINPDLLLQQLQRQLQRHQKHFFNTISWLILGMGLAAFFIYQALRHGEWPNYLVAFACFGLATFMIADRIIQTRKRPAKTDSLKTCLESSLHQLNHKIWLLRNVLWWALLPVGVPVVLSIVYSRSQSTDAPLVTIATIAVSILAVVLLYGWIYWINQSIIKKHLEPHRHALEQLLADLKPES